MLHSAPSLDKVVNVPTTSVFSSPTAAELLTLQINYRRASATFINPTAVALFNNQHNSSMAMQTNTMQADQLHKDNNLLNNNNLNPLPLQPPLNNPQQQATADADQGEDSEYAHAFAPLETHELTSIEDQWINAAIEGRFDLLQQLVNKVDVNCCDAWGSTALMHAGHRRHPECVNLILSHGGALNQQDYRGITCLMEACWNKHSEMVKLLLSHGAETNLCDERDYSALMQAAEEGHTSICQMLIDTQQVDLNKQEKKRHYTALMWAVVEGHPSVVQLLVQAGTDLNIQDKYGFTALMQAARTRFLAAVLLLVGNGADLEIRDKKGRSVYDLGNQQVLQAIEKGKRELRRRYLQMMASFSSLQQFQPYPEIYNIITSYLVNA